MSTLTYWLSEESLDKHRRKRLCLGCGEVQEYETKKSAAPSYVAWYKAHLPCRELYSPAETATLTDKFTGAVPCDTKSVAAFLQGDRVEVLYDGKWFPGTFQQLYAKEDVRVSGTLCPVKLDADTGISYHDPVNVHPLRPAEADLLPMFIPGDRVEYSFGGTKSPGWHIGTLSGIQGETMQIEDKDGNKFLLGRVNVRRPFVTHSPDPLPECPQCSFAGVALRPTGLCADCDDKAMAKAVAEQDAEDKPQMSSFTLYYRNGDTWELMPKSWELWTGARRIVEREYLRGEFQWGQKRYWAAFGSNDGPPPGVNAGTVPTFAAAASDVIPDNTETLDPRIAVYMERTGCTRAEFDELQAAGVITPRALAGVAPLNPNGDPCTVPQSFTTKPGPLATRVETDKASPPRRKRKEAAA